MAHICDDEEETAPRFGSLTEMIRPRDGPEEDAEDDDDAADAAFCRGGTPPAALREPVVVSTGPPFNKLLLLAAFFFPRATGDLDRPATGVILPGGRTLHRGGLSGGVSVSRSGLGSMGTLPAGVGGGAGGTALLAMSVVGTGVGGAPIVAMGTAEPLPNGDTIPNGRMNCVGVGGGGSVGCEKS